MFSLCLSLIVIIADLQRAMGASATPWSGAVKQENLEKLSESDKERYFQFLKRTALIHPLCWYITVLLTIFRGSKTYLFVLLSKLVFTWLLVYDLRYSDYLYCNE